MKVTCQACQFAISSLDNHEVPLKFVGAISPVSERRTGNIWSAVSFEFSSETMAAVLESWTNKAAHPFKSRGYLDLVIVWRSAQHQGKESTNVLLHWRLVLTTNWAGKKTFTVGSVMDVLQWELVSVTFHHWSLLWNWGYIGPQSDCSEHARTNRRAWRMVM